MTETQPTQWLAPGTPVDLTNCEREPIHVPGSIQPRGVLIAVSEPDLVVEQASANLVGVVGVPWEAALGRPLADVLGTVPAQAVARSAAAFGDLRERNPVELTLDRDGTPVPVDAILHRALHGSPGRQSLQDAGGPVDAAGQPLASSLVIELEPATGPRPFSFPNTYQAVRGTIAELNRATDLQSLYDITVQAVRGLTGFDRVMLYRYDAEFNGEVVAEAQHGGLSSFLGLHFPASDIPAQARALYEKNWIRLISEVPYTPALIHPVAHPATGRPLDLTYSTLRSVSPVHVEYLVNMGVAASMSISLLREDKLWGLIACHHYAGPHAPPYATRAAAEFLASTLSLRLVDRAAEEEVCRALRARSTLAWLTAATLDEERPLADSLLGTPDLLDLVPADSVVVHIEGHTSARGVPVDEALAARVAAWADGLHGDVVSSESLVADAPELDVPVDQACGALVVPLPEGQWVVWLREEKIRSVDWGGDPHHEVRVVDDGDEVRISPRQSFDRWQETVLGRAEPWTAAEVGEATELRTNLLEALYARTRRVARAAETLQRSMLSEPPQPDHVQMAVRYVPAAREAQVGGDWYDAFTQPDGATLVVIGDVVGHDTEAAAVMGQLRGLLRGIAFDSDHGPAEVLRRLDRAVEGLRLDAIASVLVARLEQTPDEARDGVTRLVWANAGHPPPVVLTEDGCTALLTAPRADLLLGVDAGAQRHEREVALTRGTTVLLYTDGLVERRDQVFDDGIAALRERLATLADTPLEQLCDILLADLVPERAEDDIALVAVRLHPQDRPRPDR